MRSPSSIETTNNEAQGSGTEDEIIGQRIEEILAIAKREGREDVPDSFCNSLVRSYVGDNCRAKSAEELFDTLRTAVDCREEIHELERSMDKSHFVELVTGGYFVSGGVEKDSNLPIFWFESGRVNNNAWKYKVGSPHANAFIRAQIFMIETYIVQASGLNPFQGAAMYADESARKALDFNVALTKQYLGIVTKLAVGVTKKFVVSGNNRFFSILTGVARTIAPNLDILSTSRFRIIEHNRIKDFVVDPRDIPMSWCNNGEGKPYIRSDRRNTWCYERCLTEQNRITSKDIYNPEPWPFEEFDYHALRGHDISQNLTEVRSGKRRMPQNTVETITEDEDDEW